MANVDKEPLQTLRCDVSERRRGECGQGSSQAP